MGIERLGLSERDITVLARATSREPCVLRAELDQRPWSILDLLENPGVIETVLEPADPLHAEASAYLFFAVLTQRAAADLRDTSVVNDWAGPGQRLPVFDVEPLREFIEAPGRVIFVARLLSTFSEPPELPAPVNALDLEGLANWLDMALPDDRVTLLSHLGDLALFRSGVMADELGSKPVDPILAERFGRSLELPSDAILELVTPGTFSPGIDAMESLGPSWYRAATDEDDEGRLSLVVADIANRFRPARRFLNHLADRYLNPNEPSFGLQL